MISLAVMNQKGGVGKSMLSSQFAFYCALKLNLKVLFLDLDQQGNSSKTISMSGLAVISGTTGGEVIAQAKQIQEKNQFLLVKSDRTLSRLESAGTERHKIFLRNFMTVIKQVSEDYDICIYDTSPTPDIRALCSLTCSDYVVSPVELNQEALDGVQALYENIQRIKQINRSLTFLGLVPNRVMSTPYQRENLQALVMKYGNILLKDEKGRAVCIPTRTAIGEAQAAGRPLWAGDKSTSERTFREVKRVFDSIARAMNLQTQSVE